MFVLKNVQLGIISDMKIDTLVATNKTNDLYRRFDTPK